MQEMGTLRCDACGEEFVIGHACTTFRFRNSARAFSIRAVTSFESGLVAIAIGFSLLIY